MGDRDDILRAQAHRPKMSYKLIGVWALLLSLTEKYANYCMLVKEVKILPGDIIVEMETGRYIARVNVINVILHTGCKTHIPCFQTLNLFLLCGNKHGGIFYLC